MDTRFRSKLRQKTSHHRNFKPSNEVRGIKNKSSHNNNDCVVIYPISLPKSREEQLRKTVRDLLNEALEKEIR